MPGSILKAQIRARVWGLLTRAGVALLPGAYGCTPLFHGVSQGLVQLQALEPWQRARRVLVLAEPVLRRLRAAAVQEGKTLVVPDLTRSAGWIAEIDPAQLSLQDALVAAEQVNSAVPGVRFLRGRDLAPVDLMVIGAVGVDRYGARVGKGAGEADLIYGLGRDRGFIGAETPVVVLIHDLQLLDEPAAREATDLPVDYIVTPTQSQRVTGLRMRPKGLHPELLSPERLATLPGLAGILAREGIPWPPRSRPHA